jgi:TolB protein
MKYLLIASLLAGAVACGETLTEQPLEPEPEIIIARVTVEPDLVTLALLGDAQQFTAWAWDLNGELIREATFIWESSDDDIVSVDQNGLAEALWEGNASITAKADDVRGAASVTVSRQEVIAYSSVPWDQRDNDDIYVVKPDRSFLRQVTEDSHQDLVPAWWPDGSKIAFVSNRNGRNVIYSVRPDGNDLTELTPDINYAMFPAISPDGQRLAFQGKVNHEDPVEIFVLNLIANELVQLTHEGKVGGKVPGNPSWSPDGTRIAFSTYRDGNWEVYGMNADGTVQVNLTNNPAIDGDPEYSPDGSSIAFGSTQRNVSDHPDEESTPTWSPDGDKIAFSGWHEVGTGTEIFILNLTSGERYSLTNESSRSSSFPAWRPQEPE